MTDALLRPPPDIVPLEDAPGALEPLVRRYEAEWTGYYGREGPGDAEADLRACLAAGADALPRCLVAVDGAGGPLGTAALKADGLGSDHFEGPWLAALLVIPAHRRHGIGRGLIAAVEGEARRLGFAGVSVATEPRTLGRMLLPRAWRPLGRIDSADGMQTVYRKELAAPV